MKSRNFKLIFLVILTLLLCVISCKKGEDETSAIRENIYVSISKGDDSTGDGSKENCYKTLGYAVSVAQSGATIHVAAGTYSHHSVFNKLTKSIHIKGGYNPDDWNDRNNTDRTNPTYKTELNSYISFGKKVDSFSIDGFIIEEILFVSKNAVVSNNTINCFSSAISGYASLMEIFNNIINCDPSGIAISVRGDNTKIYNNTINSAANGIMFSNGYCSIYNNKISYYSIGIEVKRYNQNSLIKNNVIKAIYHSYYTSSTPKGIYVDVDTDNDDIMIYNNTIYADVSNKMANYGIDIFNTGSNAVIKLYNNIIVLLTNDFLLGINVARPATVIARNNDIYLSGNGSLIGGENYIGSNGNINTNPGLDANCIPSNTSVTRGGLYISDVNDDNIGRSRTIPYSIGAYEVD